MLARCDKRPVIVGVWWKTLGLTQLAQNQNKTPVILTSGASCKTQNLIQKRHGCRTNASISQTMRTFTRFELQIHMKEIIRVVFATHLAIVPSCVNYLLLALKKFDSFFVFFECWMKYSENFCLGILWSPTKGNDSFALEFIRLCSRKSDFYLK